MSSLLFFTDSENAIVATDTLVAEPSGAPLGFSSKAIALPHLNMIIAGTGLAALFNHWVGLMNDQHVALDIDAVDPHVTEVLQQVWGEMQSQLSTPLNQTATIYHFGWSDNSREIHAYAYRSEENFRSEKLSYGLGVKPPLPSYEGLDLTVLPRKVEEVMRRQIAQEMAKPKDIAVQIGGWVQVAHLTKEGIVLYRGEDI
ncbi:hypothetical protein R6U49_00745 [Pseudomonas aeruginosa]|uniref:hypothetical protein n=3 Tax=Pseudomonas aeruginosa TaxID=287 RepID=UPI0003B2166E|nr:hypothetical protein [Pseudomonas aeruginosa]EKW6219027.1 hypothetical protein [Pseudomonas aeruginosa]ELK2660806.1 hypothetical protein [Pseudomonas aeruginosa]EMB2825407.1 hypothetical protein [Pseudomonas aeruginosa]EME0454895.1 hypothetical protein [Pseudomonas aeruginosa]EME7058344.1 hypothetical protein [Pseudomonas aeruginosa]